VFVIRAFSPMPLYVTHVVLILFFARSFAIYHSNIGVKSDHSGPTYRENKNLIFLAALNFQV
jgi:hypothetical protein